MEHMNSVKSPYNLTSNWSLTSSAFRDWPLHVSLQLLRGNRMFAEPTFVASREGLCGFILVVEGGDVDAYTPCGDLLGVFRDRIQAAQAVLQHANVEPEGHQRTGLAAA